MNKKAQIGTVGIIVILVICWAIYEISISGRECSSSDSCGQNKYCGADFKCHQFPVIYQEVDRQDYTTPALYLSIAIVLSAVILRVKKKPNEPQRTVYQERMY